MHDRAARLVSQTPDCRMGRSETLVIYASLVCRRPATVPLHGFGRAAPPSGRRRREAEGRACDRHREFGAQVGTALQAVMEAWQHHQWHVDAGAWSARVGPGVAARVAQPPQTSTFVLDGQWYE